MRRSISGDSASVPFSSFDSGSMPATFSPTTNGMPAKAAPVAKAGQYLRAIAVDPRAPVIIGIRHLIVSLRPKLVDTSASL